MDLQAQSVIDQKNREIEALRALVGRLAEALRGVLDNVDSPEAWERVNAAIEAAERL